MAKNKNGKKRLTFVTPLEAKQVRYILESQSVDEKDRWCMRKQTVVSSWFENFHQSPAYVQPTMLFHLHINVEHEIICFISMPPRLHYLL